MGITVRVVPTKGGWTVRDHKNGREGRLFATKSKAIEAGRSIARDNVPSQLVIHGRDGRIQADYVYGIPKIQVPPYRSRLGTKRIERAVLNVADRARD